jgi:hypothetical protein
LNNKFRWYGYETIQYYSHSVKERRDPDKDLRNPMCAVFPTEVSCTIPNVGAAGGEQEHNGLCVLTQNVINEKLYLALWFWYACLIPISIIFVFYRLITIFFDGVRFALIYSKVRHKYDKTIKSSLEYILDKAQLGDWFVLYQLSKNVNPYFFREFIKELALDLRQKPKRSRSRSKSRTSVGNGRSTLGGNEKQQDAFIAMLSGDDGMDDDGVGRYMEKISPPPSPPPSPGGTTYPSAPGEDEEQQVRQPIQRSASMNPGPPDDVNTEDERSSLIGRHGRPMMGRGSRGLRPGVGGSPRSTMGRPGSRSTSRGAGNKKDLKKKQGKKTDKKMMGKMGKW